MVQVIQNSANLRVLQINGYQSPGRRFNGLSLTAPLAQRGIDSKHFVWERDKIESNVVTIEDPSVRQFSRMTRGVERVLSLQSTLYQNARHIRALPEYVEADLLHFHIIHSNFLSMHSLPRMTREKPSVWTLHDPWVMTGHCIHPFECNRWQKSCGKCPDLKTDFALNFDTTWLNFQLKKFALRRAKLQVIVASSWMENLVRKSPIFDGVEVHKIPFGLDLDYFKLRSQSAAKEKLGVDASRLVLSFRSVDNDFKGLKYVVEALERLNANVPICLLTLNDKGRIEHLKEKFQVIELGWINDDEVMRDVYDATDVFIMPSLADSFGLMAVEAMTFSKPTICFNTTALPEVIFSPEAGLAVPPRDSEALSVAIKRLAEDPEERRQRGLRSRELAEKHYDINVQADRIANVYRNVHATRNEIGQN
jgi:glycosyltransferase involved in cell wall biosynthesis